MHTLIIFSHGLGDAVQLTRVLAALRADRPDDIWDVATNAGKQSLLDGLVVASWDLGSRAYRDHCRHANYDRVLTLTWDECHQCYHMAPATKASLCLDKVFGLPPGASPGPYRVARDSAAASRVLDRLGAEAPYGLLHYQGNTSGISKDLGHDTAQVVLQLYRRSGLTPILLDWDSRSPLRREFMTLDADDPLWCGLGTGDGVAIVELIRAASVFCGIDSGPLHCAMGTDTPTVAVWTQHHPIHFADVDRTTQHVVPRHHRRLIRGDAAVGMAAFASLYEYSIYDCLTEAVEGACLRAMQPGATDRVVYPTMHWGSLWLHRDMAEQDLVIAHDLLLHDTYRLGILGAAHCSGPQVVVDIGAHIGTFAYAYRAINEEARITCVEVAPANLPLLRANVDGFARVVAAACSYEPELVLLDAVFRGGESTGGSMVLPPHALPAEVRRSAYRVDPTQRVPICSLEELCGDGAGSHIDVLKVDCEGSEYSILSGTSMRDRIGMIVGEYHGRQRWHTMRRALFGDWPYSEAVNGDLGTFHLRNPAWHGCWAQQ